MVNTIITAMAAYSNERVAAIILSVLYRMLTKLPLSLKVLHRTVGQTEYKQKCPHNLSEV